MASTTSRPTASGAQRKALSEIVSSKGNGLPNRYILHAVEGWGKTSLAAQAPKPLFLQSRGETGLETLINANRLKETPHLPEAMSWTEMKAQLESVRDDQHEYKTLINDTANGVERLIHEHVCQRDFDNKWDDKGFLGYMRGFEVSLADVREYLNLLDEIRMKRGMTIFLLAHTKVRPFRNPEGADFDRYAPDMHEKTWGLMHKWADAVFFGNFEIAVKNVDRKGERGKAADGAPARVLYTEKRAAYDAKNRLGLPAEIVMEESPEQSWQVLLNHIRAGRANEVAA